MKHLFRSLFAVILIVCFASSAVAQQQMPPIPVDPNVRIGKLENGLTYYIRKNALPEKRAEFYIAQKVGSILEEDNQRGLAHFLEHMAFNGTEHFPGNNKGKGIIPYCETIGVKFGANLNAYTSIDETVYNISNVPITREGAVDSCLLILHDWANALLLTDEEIDKERGVIHEEWRTSQGATMRMYEKAFPIIYKGDKYANRLPIGTMEVVDNFPYKMLRDYYEKWYRPDLQGIIIVGDFNVDEIEAKVKTLFNQIPAPVNPAERVYFPVSNNQEPIVVVEKDKEQSNVSIYLFNKHDAVPNEGKVGLDYLIFDYAKGMINQMLDARLNELIQSANPPFIHAVMSDESFFLSKTKDAFFSVAISKEDGIETALGTLVRETERARRFGFTESEYARAKAEYLRELESQYNEREKEKNQTYCQQYVSHFIDNEPIPGIENEYAIMNQIVPNIPVMAINQIMQSLVADSNIVVSIFCPDKEGMVYPTKEGIVKVMSDVKKENLTAYEDQVSDEPLMSKLPKAGKIVSEKADDVFGTTTLTLKNGVKVILKKTDFKEDEILMKSFSLGGNSLLPDAEFINFSVIDDIIGLGGIGNFSTVNLEKVLAGKKARTNASVGVLTEGISGNCSPKDLETMLQLTYLTFTAPRMDQDAFKSFQGRMKAALLNQEVNPMTTFVDSIQSTVYCGHPRAARIKSDMIEKIDYQKVMDMYKERFKDASDFTFMLIGNIDVATAKPLIEQYLGALPSINRKENFKDTKMDMRQGIYKNEFIKKQETSKASCFTFYNGKCEYNLKNNIMLSMVAQVLNLVYTEKVREEEGGTYGVGVNGQLIKYPTEKYLMQIMFDTDPAKKDKLMKIILGEVENIANAGPSTENLNKVKEFMLKKHKEDLKENSYWLNILDEYNFEKADMTTGYEALVSSVTIQSLQEFAKKLFEQNNQVEIIMTDEVK